MRAISNRSLAILVARSILGLIFLMAGIWKVFTLGPVAHARGLFVEPYADSFIPEWSLWVTGTTIPVIEFVCGGLLLVGLFRRSALISLGAVLVVVTFGHLVADPFYEFHTHVIPRTLLLLFLLVMPEGEDVISLDALRLWRKKKYQGSPPPAS